MENYFKKIDSIVQIKIEKMPSRRNTFESLSIYLKIYKECLFEIQDEFRVFFNEFTKNRKYSESEIAELNKYNHKAMSSFVDKFKV